MKINRWLYLFIFVLISKNSIADDNSIKPNPEKQTQTLEVSINYDAWELYELDDYLTTRVIHLNENDTISIRIKNHYNNLYVNGTALPNIKVATTKTIPITGDMSKSFTIRLNNVVDGNKEAVLIDGILKPQFVEASSVSFISANNVKNPIRTINHYAVTKSNRENVYLSANCTSRGINVYVTSCDLKTPTGEMFRIEISGSGLIIGGLQTWGHVYANLDVIDDILRSGDTDIHGFAHYGAEGLGNIGIFFSTLFYNQFNIHKDGQNFLNFYGWGLSTSVLNVTSIENISIFPGTYNPSKHPVDKLRLYSEGFYSGRNLAFISSEPYLSRSNFNDMTASVEVPQGWTVRFYEHEEYQGKYFDVKGQNLSLLSGDFQKEISSFRIIETGNFESVILYSEENYKGEEYIINLTDKKEIKIEDLKAWRNKASSIKIPAGVTIVVFNKDGQNSTFTTDIHKLALFQWNNTIESLTIRKK